MGVGVARLTKMRVVRLRFGAMVRPAKMGTSGCGWLGMQK